MKRALLRVAEPRVPDKPVAWVTGWDPSSGVICEGRPTVLIFNISTQSMIIEMGDIYISKCPTEKVALYYSSDDVEAKEYGGREHRVNTTSTESEVMRPEEFPEFFWRLVVPEDKDQAQERIISIRGREILAKIIDALMNGLKEYADNKVVVGAPRELG